jgi:hypothetical protein
MTISLICFQNDEKELSKVRKAKVTIANSHTSVIEESSDFCNSYSYEDQERRSSTRSGSHFIQIPIDENAVLQSSRAVAKLMGSESANETRNRRRSTSCCNCCSHKHTSSWFHVYLCLGMLGFLIFWLVLMLRIYLPEPYWTWSYVWK